MADSEGQTAPHAVEENEPNIDLLGDVSFDDDEEEAQESETEDHAESPPAESGDDTEAPEEPEPEPEPAPAPQGPDLSERLEKAIATFENAANRLRNNPTPENRAAAEKAKSKLDVLREQDDLDVDPVSASKLIASEIMQRDGVSEKLQQQLAEIAEKTANLEMEHERLRYERKYPAIADKLDSLESKVSEKFKPYYEMYQAQEISHTAALKFLKQTREEVYESENSRLSSAEETHETPEPAPKPRATQPIKSKAGTSRKPPESSEAREESMLSKLWEQFHKTDD